MRRMNIRLSVVALALASSPLLAMAKSSGPPDGVAGNPPTMTDCTRCHGSFPVNSGIGGVEILGVPEQYEPGANYDLTVRVQDPRQQRWGFELTVLDDADPLREGGTLEVTDAVRTQLSENPGDEVDYLKQTLTGTLFGQPEGLWDFRWVAPEGDLGSITFYVAGNAADGGFNDEGDYIYTTSYSVERMSPTPVERTTWGQIKQLLGSNSSK